MGFRLNRFRATLLGVLVLFSAGIAQESKAASKPGSAVNSKPSTTAHAKRKAVSKLVDLNSAAKSELLTLPGISGAQADRIIAGRPYTSKFNLLTRSILPQDVFNGVKKRIEVR